MSEVLAIEPGSYRDQAIVIRYVQSDKDKKTAEFIKNSIFIAWPPKQVSFSETNLVLYIHLEKKVASFPIVQLPPQPGKPEFASLGCARRDDQQISRLF